MEWIFKPRAALKFNNNINNNINNDNNNSDNNNYNNNVIIIIILLLLSFAIKLRYDWEITDTPMICGCGGVQFRVHHAMVCQRGGFIIQRHIEMLDWK